MSTSTPVTPGPPAAGRLHFLDGLRGALMIFGIPFHAAVGLSGEDWVVRNDEQSLALELLAAFLHLWRMPAFFVVAGFFAVLVLHRRTPGRWLRGRLERLGIPLLFGLLAINPVQALIRGRSELGSWSAAVDSWGELMVLGGAIHLWFLRDLLVYCLVLALLAASPWRTGLARAADRAVARAMGSTWLAAVVAVGAGVAVVAMLAAWRLSGVGGVTEVFLSNQVLLNSPFFVIGAALAVQPGRLRQLAGRALAPPAAVAAACLVVLVVVARGALGAGALADATEAVAATVGGLTGALVIVGLALRHGDRDSVAVTWVVDSSLVVYLLHHVVVLAMVAWLVSTDVPAELGFLLVVVVAAVLSVLAYEIINATPGLRYLLTGRRSRATSLTDVVRAHRDEQARPAGGRGRLDRAHAADHR